MFTVLKTEGKARRCEFETVHGTVQTPAFMNVATCGAIKGGVAAEDLKELHLQHISSFTAPGGPCYKRTWRTS